MVIAIPNSSGAFAPRVSPNAKNNRFNRLNAATIGIAACSTTGLLLLHSRKLKSSRIQQHNKPQLKLNNLTITAISGAVAELFSVLALYPIDSIKVRTQIANNTSATSIFKQLIQQRGIVSTIGTLYKGVGITAMGAMCMGSIYLSAFYCSKELILNNTSSSNNNSNNNNNSNSKSSISTTHNTTNTTTTSAAFAASLSGIIASIVCSTIEAPIEALKIKSQLGLPLFTTTMTPSPLSSASRMMMVLYASFIPYLLKSIPHDVAELFTFSQLADTRQQHNTNSSNNSNTNNNHAWSLLQKSSRKHKNNNTTNTTNTNTNNINILTHIDAVYGQNIGDAIIGAASGAAAAIVSMPFDTIFTRMNLNSACMVNANTGLPLNGIKESISAFFSTGRMILMNKNTSGRMAMNVGGLFAGLGARLMYTVPAGVLYWMAVEATRRQLLQYNARVDKSNSSVVDDTEDGYRYNTEGVFV